MDDTEFTLNIRCIDCAEWVDRNAPWFEISLEAALCHECAVRRGGHFDSELDEWVMPPDVALLHRFLEAHLRQ